MVPGLRLLPDGAAIVHVTAVLAVPLRVAANCRVDPMVTVAGLGVMAILGAAYVAVTVVLALTVTLQVVVLVVVQPDHEEKLLPPAVAGAVNTTAVPEL
jgi:hypothetical protein